MSKHFTPRIAAGALACALGLPAAEALAATQVVSGTVFKVAAGTNVDYWRIVLPAAGTLTIDMLAYESTDNTPANGRDLNGDGEITFLDPDTSLFKYSGLPLKAADWILRCDDVDNTNGVCADVMGDADGSIHKRDPFFSVSLPAGSYVYVVGDYRTTVDEAVGRLNAGDSIRNGGDHGDYRISISSDAAFLVTPVPEPETWAMFLAGLGVFVRRLRRTG